MSEFLGLANDDCIERLRKKAKTDDGRAQIERILATLSVQEERVLRMRIGLPVAGGLKSVAEKYSVPMERIREIENRARLCLNRR